MEKQFIIVVNLCIIMAKLKKEPKMKKIILSLIISAVIISGCTGVKQGTPVSSSDAKRSYTKISQDEAKKMMEKDDGHVIVDVRRDDEYATGHIPGAILIPNESIGTEKPAELPDPDQIILVYCRSGNRSAQASQKLADLGYTNVFDFGGIMTWTGEIEK